MEHARKMIVVPAEQMEAPIAQKNPTPIAEPKAQVLKKGNIIKQRSQDRFNRVLQIALGLARINGYDTNGRIRSGDSYLDNTDIVLLINHILTPQKVIYGESEFLNLLKEANLDPSLIPNENFRLKLFKLNTRDKSINVVSNKVIEKPTEETKIVPKKRAADESEEEPLRKKKLSNWTIPDSDDEF